MGCKGFCKTEVLTHWKFLYYRYIKENSLEQWKWIANTFRVRESWLNNNIIIYMPSWEKIAYLKIFPGIHLWHNCNGEQEKLFHVDELL